MVYSLIPIKVTHNPEVFLTVTKLGAQALLCLQPPHTLRTHTQILSLGAGHLNLMLCTRAPLSKDDDYMSHDITVPTLLQQGWLNVCSTHVHFYGLSLYTV